MRKGPAKRCLSRKAEAAASPKSSAASAILIHTRHLREVIDPRQRGAAPDLARRPEFTALIDGADANADHSRCLAFAGGEERRTTLRAERQKALPATLAILHIK